MTYSHRRFKTRYVAFRRRNRARLKARPYLLPVAGLLFGVAIVFAAVLFGGRPVSDFNSHVVDISVDDSQRVLPTRASTVAGLLANLHIKLAPEDVVEPAADTPILEDNFRVNIYRAKPVTVLNDGKKIVVLTAKKSARLVAEEAGVTVYPEDKVSFARGTLAEGVLGEKVVIDPATPIALNLYGTLVTVRTHAKTVGELLDQKQVKLAASDQVQPAPATPLTPGLPVFVVRSGTQIQSAEEPVEPPTQTVNDASLSFGTTVVRQAGMPGKKLVTYQLELRNGQIVKRQIIQQIVIQEPVPRIVAVGKTVNIPADKTVWMAAAGIKSSDYAYVNYIISRESGWCPTKWQGEYGSCPPYHGVPSSGGYGLGQATPGSKMTAFGADWATNPVTQLKWASSYANTCVSYRMYCGWQGAYNHWLSYHNW